MKIDTGDLNRLFNHFGSDKGTSAKNQYKKNSKKRIGHGFAKFYKKYLNKDKRNMLLEIGTWEGASAAAFNKYLKKSKIFCLDRNFKMKYFSKNIFYFNCNTESKADLNRFLEYKNKITKKKFDFIIDDGVSFIK